MRNNKLVIKPIVDRKKMFLTCHVNLPKYPHAPPIPSVGCERTEPRLTSWTGNCGASKWLTLRRDVGDGIKQDMPVI